MLLAVANVHQALEELERVVERLGGGASAVQLERQQAGQQAIAQVAPGVTEDVNTLKGKVIGVADLNSPAKQFFAIHLSKKGIDVDKDVEWRVFPADLLDVAARKGEIHAIADGDPNLYLLEKRNPGVFVEIGNSAKGEYAEKICCVLGAATGFVLGVWIGWSRVAGYWVHPVLRFLGPLPPSALLPLAFFFAPSSFSAAIFLIALATFFPVAVLTWSGVANVSKSYYDVARTLGASEWFLVLRVAIPAALPQVFVGIFMGLGGAFSVLITAEMMGVKAGLGWYLQWAQGWAAYANMYGALLVMAALCSGLITLLFAVRDRVLTWQKGTVKW